VAGTTLWELALTSVHCWLLIGFAVPSAVACLHRRSALAVAAFGAIGFLLLFAIATASLGRDGSSQATLGPWSFAVGDSVVRRAGGLRLALILWLAANAPEGPVWVRRTGPADGPGQTTATQ
jgi:NADH:ubiquinone oxidoreductase subunit 5 (subunit L)/multisubunit Na+/H+ antiporter MnhA subunit